MESDISKLKSLALLSEEHPSINEWKVYHVNYLSADKGLNDSAHKEIAVY